MAKLVSVLLCPSIANKPNEMSPAGSVLHKICLMCVKRSVSTTAEAKLLVSDNGDNLSPKIPPLIIAPATKAGFRFMVTPMSKKAIPTVDVTVKALPTAAPTRVQTIKTDGKNH